jgi:hypothetical protein
MTETAPRLTFTFEQLADCAERELNKRRHVYPNRIVTNRMSRQVANRELDMMREIGEYLRAMAAKERLL